MLQGIVKDAKGHPIEGADIRIETKNGGKLLTTVKTDVSGRYILEGLPPNAGFFAPAGLHLGAETSEEIALAIVSEIQRVFAGSSGESLRERRMSIHGDLRCANMPALSKR